MRVSKGKLRSVSYLHTSLARNLPARLKFCLKCPQSQLNLSSGILAELAAVPFVIYDGAAAAGCAHLLC